MIDVREISAYGLSSPLDPSREFDFHGGVRRIHKRDFVIVAVELADGTRGYAPAGASSSAMREYFDDATQDTFVEFVESVVAHTLEGECLDSIGAVHEVLAELNQPEFLISQATAAVDVALHDILGKLRGVPVHELLAPDVDVPDRIPLYASGGMYMEPEEYAIEAAEAREAGFPAYKYRSGIGPEADERTIRRIRASVGDEMDVMVDAHTWWKTGDGTYDVETMVDLAATYADCDVFLLEEPVAPDDIQGYRTLARETSVPLAGGENAESSDELTAFGRSANAEFVQGDVRHHQGYLGCLRAHRNLDGHDVRFVPHNFGTYLGLVANAHLAVAIGGIPYLEYPLFETETHAGMYPYPLATDILETDLTIADGHLQLPTSPGLGVEVDRSVIKEYPYVEGAWTEFLYADET